MQYSQGIACLKVTEICTEAGESKNFNKNWPTESKVLKKGSSAPWEQYTYLSSLVVMFYHVALNCDRKFIFSLKKKDEERRRKTKK